jgi:excisionase family DNA binding protein
MSRRRIRINTPGGSKEAVCSPRKKLSAIRPVAQQTASQIAKLACSIQEAATYIGVSKRLVERLVASGEIPSRKVGSRRLIPVASLTRWLEGK